ncbi:hypothetical protein GIB67_035259 [Kingdonia uniflora]|uniref:Uncharacterized protein n=1 Tax=Kingdonia uniflora TaxID=39325 RepID=A0A7J7KXX4_9MAGN|nr:hypothetical protein GIB67_035259 [Kingdonia uniflora]
MPFIVRVIQPIFPNFPLPLLHSLLPSKFHLLHVSPFFRLLDFHTLRYLNLLSRASLNKRLFFFLQGYFEILIPP